MTPRGHLVATLLIMAACGLATPAAFAEDNNRGEVLFDLCSSCHGVKGEGHRIYLAPAIAGLSEWYVLTQLQNFRGGLRGTHFDDLAGMRMRPMSLTLRSDADVEAVAKYVASLPKTLPARELSGGDPAKGQASYALCASCHGARGEGVKATNGPPLAHLNDWYLLEQLRKYKAGIRGTNPKDINGIMMRPMALTLTSDQAMLDVVAYITSLSK